MADLTVHKVDHGWAGDRRRQKVVVTAANGKTLTPVMCGLSHIEAIRPTHRIGEWESGQDLATCSHVGYTKSTTVVVFYSGSNADSAITSGKVELYVYGI